MNENNSEWDWYSYRLSLLQMQSLADHSTHLRATCNFPTDGLQYTDYARAKLAGHDIFGNWEGYPCKMYEYVNIRGKNCSDCTALTKQKHHKAWTMNGYNSIKAGCELACVAGVQRGGRGEVECEREARSLGAR